MKRWRKRQIVREQIIFSIAECLHCSVFLQVRFCLQVCLSVCLCKCVYVCMSLRVCALVCPRRAPMLCARSSLFIARSPASQPVLHTESRLVSFPSTKQGDALCAAHSALSLSLSFSRSVFLCFLARCYRSVCNFMYGAYDTEAAFLYAHMRACACLCAPR